MKRVRELRHSVPRLQSVAPNASAMVQIDACTVTGICIWRSTLTSTPIVDNPGLSLMVCPLKRE